MNNEATDLNVFNPRTQKYAAGTVPDSTAHYLRALEQAQKAIDEHGETDFFDVQENTDVIYKTYESIRNSVEYTEEHMLMRGAIDRYLRRHFNQRDASLLVEQLVTELTLAGYVEDQTISTRRFEEIVRAISSYQQIIAKVDSMQSRSDFKQFTGLVSAHVQDIILKNERLIITADFIHQRAAEKNGWLEDEQMTIPLYIAVERVILKSDEATIKSRLFRKSYGSNLYANPAFVAGHYPHFIQGFEAAQRSQQMVKANAALRKQSASFITLATILRDSQSTHALRDSRNLSTIAQATAEDLYASANTRLWRGIRRSLVFLILTKALVGVAVEIPYDLAVYDEIQYTPLVINLLFPPFYLLLTSAFVRIPDNDNTQTLIKHLRTIVYEPQKLHSSRAAASDGGGALLRVFNAIYFLLSIAIFTGLVIALVNIGFNIVGLAVFFIYFSSVSYFSYRVTNVVRELKVYSRRAGSLSATFIAILTTPFVRLGQWLSARYQSINLVVFIFDFLVEAPIKAISHAFRRWKSFIKDKQDDAL